MKKKNNDERRYERTHSGYKSNVYLLQILNDYYGSYEERVDAIGITCLDCKRQTCPESCVDKSRIELIDAKKTIKAM